MLHKHATPTCKTRAHASYQTSSTQCASQQCKSNTHTFQSGAHPVIARAQAHPSLISHGFDLRASKIPAASLSSSSLAGTGSGTVSPVDALSSDDWQGLCCCCTLAVLALLAWPVMLRRCRLHSGAAAVQGNEVGCAIPCMGNGKGGKGGAD